MTHSGEAIAARANSILFDVQELSELAKEGQNPFASTFRLGVLQSLGPYLLPHILPQLRNSYPNLRLHLREAMPDDLLQGLQERRLDLLFFPLPVRNNNFHTSALFEESLWLVVPKDHQLASREEVSVSEIKGETVLTLERGHRLHDQVRDLCSDFDANLARDYEGTSLDTVRQMVGMGMGIAFMPALYVKEEVLDDNQVVACPLGPQPPTRMMGMIWHRQSSHHDEFSALASMIQGIIKDRLSEIAVLQQSDVRRLTSTPDLRPTPPPPPAVRRKRLPLSAPPLPHR